MTVLTRLKVDGFRNLSAVDLHVPPRFNLLYGQNGSGKTSALEAIHVLSVGRSFRTHKIDPLISVKSDQFLIYAELKDGQRLGLQRGRSGPPVLRLDGATLNNWSQIAMLMPLQVINTDSFGLLEGGGKARRRFLDWAMFHVEHSFLNDWRAYRRLVAQRNVLLKQKSRNIHAQLDAWDVDLIRLAENIHNKRTMLLTMYQPWFERLVGSFLRDNSASLIYLPGWNTDLSFAEVLSSSRDRDLRYGMTLVGPHRADFQIKIDKHHAIEVLSRGQTKMLICALKLAMGQLIKSSYINTDVSAYQPGYLIDDLAAELDEYNAERVIRFLYEAGDQCFFTAIEESALGPVADLTETSGKFHVEHGKIRAVTQQANRRNV